MAANKTGMSLAHLTQFQHFKGGLPHPPRSLSKQQGHQCADQCKIVKGRNIADLSNFMYSKYIYLGLSPETQ